MGYRKVVHRDVAGGALGPVFDHPNLSGMGHVPVATCQQRRCKKSYISHTKVVANGPAAVARDGTLTRPTARGMRGGMKQRLLELLLAHSYKEGDFLLASGKRSTFYIDVRATALTAEGAALIGDVLLDLMHAQGWAFSGAGGMTLGADPLTTAVGIASWNRDAPVSSFIVRKAPKDHGAGKQVEVAGTLEDGASVVVLDDTITTGGSTVKAIHALRKAGYKVVGAACLVDRCEGGEAALTAEGVPLVSAFTIEDLRNASV